MTKSGYRMGNWTTPVKGGSRNDANSTNLHFAAQNGDLPTVEKLLKEGADILAVDHKGNTPLHLAAQNGCFSTVKKLLEEADILAVDHKGNTPLHLAVQNGHLSTVKKLLEEEADILAVDHKGNTPLHLAASDGDFETMNFLIEYISDFFDIINQGNGRGSSIMHIVALYGSREDIEYLLEKGADIAAVDHEDNTPLHYAVLAGNSQAIEILSNSETLNSSNKMEHTALDLVLSAKRFGVVEKLIELGAKSNFFDEHGVQMVMQEDNGERLSINGDDLNRPLHIVTLNSIKSRHAYIELLLDAGADVNALNQHGNTALHYAALKGDKEAVRILLENSTDYNMVNEKGQTPLHYAATSGDVSTIEALLETDQFDVNDQDARGHSALYHAVMYNNYKAIDCLIRHGAKIDLIDKKGATPLHYAVSDNLYESAICLIEKGADINQGDAEGRTPLHYASLKENSKIVTYLFSCGVDFTKTDHDNKTALELAKEKFGEENNIVMILEKLENGGSVFTNIIEDIGDLNEQLKLRSLRTPLFDGQVEEKNIIEEVPPLHLAVASNNIREIEEILSQEGVNINRVDDLGNTALHYAVALNNIEAAALLIEKGIDDKISNNKGYTVLEISKDENLRDSLKQEIKEKIQPLLRPSSSPSSTDLDKIIDSGIYL